jgi:hypothetical protein
MAKKDDPQSDTGGDAPAQAGGEGSGAGTA